MKVGILFSGGKDSTYSAYLAQKRDYEIACLISVFSENPESYMFHTPSISRVKEQAKVMEIPLLVEKTKGEKEKELIDLEKAIKKAQEKYQIQAIVTGAVASKYQKERIEKICKKLKLKCINPLWGESPEKYWNELLNNGFEIIITGVASLGLDEEWLGKKIDQNTFNLLKDLSEKFHFHLGFEGGEAETFVTDCPLFKKRLKILEAEKKFFGTSGVYNIVKMESVNK